LAQAVHGTATRRQLPRTQFALFDDDQAHPAGLNYVREFISPPMERDLIARIRELPLMPFQFGRFEGKRKVFSFGYRYDFFSQRVEHAEPVPDWLRPVIEAVERYGALSPQSIDHVLCTEYEAGTGIGWHRDKKEFDQVFGLSLGSACNFRFRRKVGAKWQRYTLTAEPRSLYRMTGEVRHVWEHSIPAVDALRYSITFRTMVR
jgi:alkylated DNA repair dioxygenase AlkB